jgi:acyl-CoA reductase-like NAD-dependent aldehyde dehydrogenase
VSSGTALLLVDVQNDFLARDGLEPAAPDLIASIAALIDLARRREWAVVHVRTSAAADGSNWMPHWRDQGRAPCIEGTPGCEAPAGADALPGEAVLTKRFFSAFDNPDLSPLLEDGEVATLIVAGVHAHACIRATVTDAYARGFQVLIASEAVGSYDPEHSALTLDWLDGRAGRRISLAELSDWQPSISTSDKSRWELRNPSDWGVLLDKVPLGGRAEVASACASLTRIQPGWGATPIGERRARLQDWHGRLAARRDEWIALLGEDVGKPRRDAEGEISYGLALVERLCATLTDEEESGGRVVRYRPHGIVGLITPWNNPFAIPISKIAPALGFGNAALWKPALPATRLSHRLHASLAESGLGAQVAIVTGGVEAGRAVVESPSVDAISFTGSIAVGRQIARRCGQLMRPLQAELGGNNAAIVLPDADPASTAQDLATAMFSFAGQRCTAIRRVIFAGPGFEAFAQSLKASVETLRVGSPADPLTDVGPVISPSVRDALLAKVSSALQAGARPLTRSELPSDLSASGCWFAPTVLTDLPAESPVLSEELFGPVVALVHARDLDAALSLHNQVEQGLLGAIYTQDGAAQARFLAEAEAGLLSVNRARPAFSATGPFVGWKGSGYGMPEHGRWNRDFYTRVQAAYRH